MSENNTEHQILSKKIKNFVDITDLWIKHSTDTIYVKTFHSLAAIQGLENFSYGVLDENFMSQIDHQHIFFAGGSLLSCFTQKIYQWSDIDMWVCGESETDIINNTIKLLQLLEHSFRTKGYDKLLWSIMNNVITCYCVGYSRNIQIIMVKGDAETNINNFDFDYVKVFMRNNKIYSTLEFIDSFIEKKISYTYQIDNIKDNRLLKALMKGYSVSDELMNIKKIAHIVNQYNALYDNSKKDEPNIQFINSISKIRNKYYYPTEFEYVEFVSKKEPYYESRVYYMINQMCGHDIIHNNLSDIISNLTLKTHNKVNFTTQYTVNYSDNNTHMIKKLPKDTEAKYILVDPENVDKNNGLCIQAKTFIHPESKRIKIPITMFNKINMTENNPYIILSGPLTINSRFLWNISDYENTNEFSLNKKCKFSLVRSCKIPNTDPNIDIMNHHGKKSFSILCSNLMVS